MSPSPEPTSHPIRFALLGLLLIGAAAIAAALLSSGQDGGSSRARAKHGPPRPAKGVSGPADLRKLAARLPRDRQVAQLFVIGFSARQPSGASFHRVLERDWGGVMLGRANFVDSQQLTALTGEIATAARRAAHLAPFIAAPQVGGAVSVFPDLPPRAQPAVGASGQDSKAAADARAAGRALKKLHVNMTLAPLADVGNAGSPLEDRVFGDDPGLVARMVRAAVSGYRASGVISAVGHFPGQGSASQDPDEGTTTVGLGLPELRGRDLKPFGAVAGAAPVIIMSNAVYAAYDGVTPAVLLPEAIGSLLRGRLHFKGAVMTDDLVATAPVLGQGVGSAAVDALRAGADLLYVSGPPSAQDEAYAAVLGAVRKKKISRRVLEQALVRVLVLKRDFGLLPRR